MVVAALSVIFQWPAWRQTPVYASATLLASLSVVFVGLILLQQKNMRPLAIGCIACGLVWSLQWVVTWNRSVLPFVGFHANMLFFAIGGIGFLLTPSGRPIRKPDRFFISAFLTIPITQQLAVAVSRPEWSGYSDSSWWPALYPNHRLFDDVVLGLYVYWAALSVAFCFACGRRVQEMKSLDRVVAIPMTAGFCLIGLVAGFSSAVQPFVPIRQTTFFCSLSFVMFSIPAAFIVSILRRIIRRAYLTEQLSRRLTRRVLTGDVVRSEFRALLADPTLDLYYWSEQSEGYVDTDGHNVVVSRIDHSGFAAFLTDGSGHPMAVVVGDAMLIDHMSMLRSFLAASAIAIENVQLQASVKAQLEQVRASRSRIIEATLEERRRIERDLHDGVQQRLLAIQARIGAYKKQGGGNADAILRELGDELRLALSSLRELARGIHPSELRQFGIRGAIEVVVERLPIDVSMDVTDERFSAAVESTVYFVVCEALANAMKHSRATSIDLHIARKDQVVEVKIRDNGTGGARVAVGGGLEGLCDRLKTMGGELTIESDRLVGSVIMTKLPL